MPTLLELRGKKGDIEPMGPKGSLGTEGPTEPTGPKAVIVSGTEPPTPKVRTSTT